jgi:hypothetical protein
MKLPLFPESASNFAPDVDHLLFYPGRRVGVLHRADFLGHLLLRHPLPAAFGQRPAEAGARQPGAGDRVVGDSFRTHHDHVRMGRQYILQGEPPAENAMQIYVVAKQWMWKMQHMEGQREINELHIPVGRPVKLTMTSEDVIHSFFVPAFRTKQDVVPGRYSTTWFTATKPGKYHLILRRVLRHQAIPA